MSVRASEKKESCELQIHFNGRKTIEEIDVFTVQDNYAYPSEPTEAMTFSLYGLTGFDVQYWNGSAWATVPGGSVTGNNKVWKKITFSPITTTKIRVLTNACPDGYSRITEVEAWTSTAAPPPTNVALAANGGIATASSSYPGGYGPGGAINGGRKGDGAGDYWNDAAPANTFPDWLQIDFNGSKSIGEIDVFTIQDNYQNPSEPTEAMTFSLYGLTGFDVQYWNGSAWASVPGGSVTGNNKVWKKITFSPITTTKIRVLTNACPDGYSRITELEAWTAASSGAGSSANVKWLVTDQLGTPRMIFDQTGSQANVSRHDYLPFGEELYGGMGGRTSGMGYGVVDAVRQQFTSKEREIETGLDYFLARYYSATQGRFTSADEPFADQRRSNPQSWNLYSYVKNSPCNNVDPNGKCSAPSGLAPGSVGICIEAFIAARGIGPGGIGRGDDRTFSGNDPNLTARLRVDLIVTSDPKAGTASITESTQASESTVDVPMLSGDLPVSAQGTASTQITDAKIDKDGTTTFTSTTTGKSGFTDVPVVGRLAPKGTIDISLKVAVTKDGKVGLNQGGSSKNYPSYAVYSYRYDEKGNLVTKEIFRRQEGDLKDLNKPKVAIPKVKPK